MIAAVIIGGFVGALFFSSRHHVFGPTSSISLIVAATIASNSNTGLTSLQLAGYLAFLIGVIQLLAGLLNFGEVTKFISRSVVVAYSTGIGILLIASQLHNLLGYSVDAGQNFSANVWQALFDLGTARVFPWAIGIGALTFLIFWAVRRFRPGWPEALIGLGLLAIGAKAFTFYHHTVPFFMVRDEGALTAVMPSFANFHIGPRKIHSPCRSSPGPRSPYRSSGCSRPPRSRRASRREADRRSSRTRSWSAWGRRTSRARSSAPSRGPRRLRAPRSTTRAGRGRRCPPC